MEASDFSLGGGGLLGRFAVREGGGEPFGLKAELGCGWAKTAEEACQGKHPGRMAERRMKAEV